jgi:hypothetical protein
VVAGGPLMMALLHTHLLWRCSHGIGWPAGAALLLLLLLLLACAPGSQCACLVCWQSVVRDTTWWWLSGCEQSSVCCFRAGFPRVCRRSSIRKSLSA